MKKSTDNMDYLIHGLQNGKSKPFAVITDSSVIKIEYDF